MAKTVSIMVACGTGMMTSNVVAGKIEEIAKELNVPVMINTRPINDVANAINDYDMLLTVMPYRFPEGVKYAMNAVPLAIGVNEEACIDQIREWLMELSERTEENA